MQYSEGNLILFNMTLTDLRNYKSYSCSRPMKCGEQVFSNSDILFAYKNDDLFNITSFKASYCLFSCFQPPSLSFEIMIIISKCFLCPLNKSYLSCNNNFCNQDD
jgi:hypothetical protein